ARAVAEPAVEAERRVGGEPGRGLEARRRPHVPVDEVLPRRRHLEPGLPLERLLLAREQAGNERRVVAAVEADVEALSVQGADDVRDRDRLAAEAAAVLQLVRAVEAAGRAPGVDGEEVRGGDALLALDLDASLERVRARRRREAVRDRAGQPDGRTGEPDSVLAGAGRP